LGLNIEVESYDGKSKVSTFLRSLWTRPEFAQKQIAAMAILRDADADSNAAFMSVRDALRQNHFEPPAVDKTFSESIKNFLRAL